MIVVLGLLLGLVIGASPAGADPAEPTNYRSRVLAETPDAPGVEVRIEGGDAFVTIEVEPGHTVIVEGYDGEEWLRVDPEGTVSQNLRSRATYLNGDRVVDSALLADVPTGIAPTDPPEHEVVGDGGRYTWHDHRTHWMSPDPPPSVIGRESETVVVPLVAGSSEWTIGLIVDGTPTVVTGQLVWNPDVPSGWRIATIALGLTVAAVAWRRGAASLRWSAPLVGLAGLAMLVVAVGEWRGQPAAVRGSGTEVITPTVVVVLAAVGVWQSTRRRDRRDLSALATLGATLIGILWAFGRTETIRLPVLPSTLSSATLRVLYVAIVALIAAGAGAARVVLVSVGGPTASRAAPRRRIGPTRRR